MAVTPDLIETVRAFDARLCPLQNSGINVNKPGWIARLRSGKELRASMHTEEQRLRDEVDRSGILPRLVEAYITGNDDERRELRALFKECKTFARRWGPEGRKIAFAERPASAEQLLRSLAVHAMRDGDPDYRDEILLLDSLCRRAKDAGLDGPALLRQGADMASANARGQRKSFKDTLLDRAKRVAQAHE